MDAFEIAQSAANPAVVADEADRLLSLNQPAEEFLGYHRDAVVGKTFHQLIEGRDVFGNRLCREGRSLHEMIRGGEPVQAFDIDVRLARGEYHRVRVAILAILGPGNGSYRLVYHLIPRIRRRRADEAIDFLLKHHGGPERPEAANSNGDEKLARLTRRERQVLQRLSTGENTRKIADSLSISPHTLRSHTQNILRKLGAHSKVEAVSYALRQNLV